MTTATNTIWWLDKPTIEAEVYHAQPGVSNSRLSVLIEDPREYHYQYLSGKYVRKPKAYFDFGSAVHDIALQNSTDGIKCIPSDVLTSDGKKAGGVWKAFATEHAGKILLKSAEYDQVMGCVDAISNHPAASRLLSCPGKVEATFEHLDDELGLLLRCRPDKLILLNDAVCCLDLKTTATGTQAGKFVKSIANLGYHRQEYFYRRVLRANGIDVASFIFIAVQTEPPYCVDCYTLSDEFLRLAETQVESALLDLAERTRANDWQPRTINSVVQLDPPQYLKYQSEYCV